MYPQRTPLEALQRAEQALRHPLQPQPFHGQQHQQGYGPLMTVAPSYDGGYGGGGTFGGGFASTAVSENAMSVAELSRQLRVCMGEIKELRTELAVERDSRSHAVSAFAKRLKEEIHVDVRSMEHHLQRAIREAEATSMHKISELETQRGLDRRRLDEAVRLTKVADRSQFDQAEQIRDVIDDIRTRVDQAVALTTASRVETTQQLEKERNSMTHRLDVELMRYADLHRQQLAHMAQTKQAVAQEVGEVAKTVRSIVEQCWEARATVLTKTLNESVAGFKQQQEKQGHAVADISLQLAQAAKDGKRDLQTLAGDLRDRIVGLESGVPLLAARVDRFERKADAVLESTNKTTAHVEVLKEMADKASVLAQRSMERAQKVEDTLTDRDERLLQLESQASQLAGLDRVKAESEQTRRVVSRLEGQIDAVKQIADRDERLVDTMQRSMDASLERADAVEKKAHKVVARVETAEQRVVGFVDRLVAIETQGEKLASVVERTESSTETAAQRLAAAENRQRVAADKSESIAKDMAERLHGLELRFDSAIESSSRSETIAQGAKKDLERFEKRLAKMESGIANTLENVKETRDAVDGQQKELAAVRKRADAWKESFDRQEHLLETKSSDVASTEGAFHEKLSRAEKRIASAAEAAEKRGDDRADQLARRLEELSNQLKASAARNAASTFDAQQQARLHQQVPSNPAMDDALLMDVAATRRKCDTLASRVQQLESGQSILEGECARRHELTAMRSAVLALETSLQNFQRDARNQPQQQQMQQQPVQTTTVQQRAALSAAASAAAGTPTTPTDAPVKVAATPVASVAAKPLPKPLTVVVAAAPVASLAASPTAAAPKKSTPPPPPPQPAATSPFTSVILSHILPAEAAPAALADLGEKDSVMSGVSSVKPFKASAGGFDSDSDDDVGGDRPSGVLPSTSSAAAATTTAAAAKQYTLQDPGRPPLRSPVKGASSPNAGAAPAAAAATAKQRSPYSDTSGSEDKRPGPLQAQTTLPPLPGSGAAPPPPVRSGGETVGGMSSVTGAKQHSAFDEDDELDFDDSPQPPHAVSAILQTSRGGGGRDSSEGTSDDYAILRTAASDLPGGNASGAKAGTSPVPAAPVPAAAASKAPAAAGGGGNTSDEGPSFQRSVRKSFISGDSSGAEKDGPSGPAATAAAATATTATAAAAPVGGASSSIISDASSKKFHVTKATKAQTSTASAFDDDDEDDDADPRRRSPQSQRSRASRRSYASKRTSDVSLSLDSSRSRPGNRSGAGSGKNEETIEDLEDDDQLAEMLGFIGQKKK